MLNILSYDQLSHPQRRLVHHLLRTNPSPPSSFSYPPTEHQQWTIWNEECVQATLGFHVFEHSVQLLNASYTDLQAFQRLAHYVHSQALLFSPRHIDVQIIPPYDFGFVTTWNALGYCLSSEQFRLIGLTHDRPASVQFKPLSSRNRHLFLTIRNDAIRYSEFLFPYDAAHLDYLIDQGVLPYLVYDKKTIVGTILMEQHKQVVRLLEIACLPQLKNQGYGRRILDTFQTKLHKKNILSFEVYCCSTHQEALRLYQPTAFCDIQIFSNWHRYSSEAVSLVT
ncbi:GNAT family N-acetyltransferase [Exiguobacterium sp. Helios]|uniref:GNAT family N-acetyltransferase n=1 Tax=Exiguobacterium sp. Helios TaxID=2735868 RepID=UPI00165D4B3B|nr:GNAT family N-acetyltransferase [Exiguobacterium sp. Helios]QNR20197.1 GNAT family N-acetyltransferase [Exiguobacterium sp. Helios]